MPDRRRTALAIQAAYYIASGSMPLLSRRTFEALTGPKRDWWLVQMVALLAVTSGLTIAVGLQSGREPSRETLVLSALSAASFSAIDLCYSLNGTISPIYLADAFIEAALTAAVFFPIQP
jgi:hypothetical protein